ncbi:hypothetical protein A9Q99_22885 [Gammaproteobacteria bacterium 45_16_T64]|nr:hypothetical protein A9Q99_22885 [Gammaproteobacteria bacterium 45_16_T64]
MLKRYRLYRVFRKRCKRLSLNPDVVLSEFYEDFDSSAGKIGSKLSIWLTDRFPHFSDIVESSEERPELKEMFDRMEPRLRSLIEAAIVKSVEEKSADVTLDRIFLEFLETEEDRFCLNTFEAKRLKHSICNQLSTEEKGERHPSLHPDFVDVVEYLYREVIIKGRRDMILKDEMRDYFVRSNISSRYL